MTESQVSASHGQGPFIAAIDQGTTSSPLHRLRQGRPDRRRRPEGTRADLPQAGLGRARRRGDLDQRPAGRRRSRRQGRHHLRRRQGDRHHQPARDHAAVGQEHRRAGAQRHRLAGHPHRRAVPRARPQRRPGPLPPRDRPAAGLYFAGPKIRWLLDNVEGLRERAERGDILFGTMDSWVIWNLTGGVNGGVHVTDVTNASRTMLMNLAHPGVGRRASLASMGVPTAVLPEIRSSAEVYGNAAVGVARRRAGRLRARRPAGRAVRPDLLRRGRGQVAPTAPAPSC